jgi:hypothetical protein
MPNAIILNSRVLFSRKKSVAPGNTVTYKFDDPYRFLDGEDHLFVPDRVEATVDDFCLCVLLDQK